MNDNIQNLHDRMHFDPSSKDTGSASVFLDLHNSIITVKHGETKEVLMQFDAIHGDWVSIMHFIQTLELGRNTPPPKLKH